MHKTLSFTLLLIALLAVASCSAPKKADFSTPEGTFAAMLDAIAAKDLAAYEACWHPDKAQAEGLVSFIKADGKTWDMLQPRFKPGAVLKNGRDETENGRTIRYFDVEASYLAEGQEIEAVGLVQEGKDWKMWHW